MDNPFESPVVISLCTGGRMLERGLERAIGPVTIAAYVEIEAFCIFNLVAQMEQGVVAPAPVWSDLKTFPAPAFHRKVHGIIGGYPCQPFSLAGKRGGERDPRHLWPYIRRHVRAIGPVWCFFENVRDHLTLGYQTVYQELRDMGYQVEAAIYSAAEVGAPHERQRLFILAISNTYSHRMRQLPVISGQPGRHQFNGDGTTRGVENTIPNTNGIDRRISECEQGQKWEESQYSPNPTRSGAATDLDNSNCERQRQIATATRPGQGGYVHHQNNQTGIPGETDRPGNGPRWPSAPGEPQNPWEEQRTVKPGVGCTVNGYKFTEDLLRMLGNGVVEQTAELAFIDLMHKHLRNIS